MRARQFAVPADVRQVALVRQVARRAALDWGVPEDVADDAVLVVSELATNAILHASSTVRVGLHLADEVLRVEVYDDLATRPTARDAGMDSAGGRGLHLVASLARRWGVQRLDDGKCVWAELVFPPQRVDHEGSLAG
ncbi:MAG TPA: ATP-binding protein [Mycobacteriales bacterium]|nr:ATP-binding protein [Mycobacteriales bacterium]